jgi:transposase
MSNPVPKEVTIERERRAWELRQKGWSHRRIAAELGIDDSTVTKALQRVTKRALIDLKDKVEEMKTEQTFQLDHIQDEAMQAWERSKEDAELSRTVTKKIGATPKKEGLEKAAIERQSPDAENADDADRTDWERPGMYLAPDGEETTEEERRRLLAEKEAADNSPLTVIEERTTGERKGQVGDPRFLEQAQKAMDAKRAIWGIESPRKQELSGPSGGPIKVKEVVVRLTDEDEES